MKPSNRRKFLHDVGTGMLVAGAGSIVYELGVGTTHAADGNSTVSLGEHERLVDLFLTTPLEKLQPAVVKQLKSGQASLADVTAAAALMSARTFGGQNYVGYHCEMALSPALEMSSELPTERRALPVLKVLYRTCANIESNGARRKQTLKPVRSKNEAETGDLSMLIRDATRRQDMGLAERLFAQVDAANTMNVYNMIQPMALDFPNVHRVVLDWDTDRGCR